MVTKSTESAAAGTRNGVRALLAERHALILALIVLTGLILRLGLFAIAWRHPQRFLDRDSFDYLAVGQRFSEAVVHGQGPFVGLSVFRPPGYPAFIALFHSPSIRLIVFGQIALTTLTTVLVYRITKLLFDEPAALIAALIVAVDPASIIYSAYVLSESVAAFLLLLGTWIWLQAVRTRRLSLGAVAGVAYAMVALVRPIGLYLPIVLLPLSFLFQKGGRGFRVALALIVTVSFLLPVGSWMLRNRELTGSAIFSSVQGYTLLYFTAAGALAHQEHVPIETVQLQLRAQEQAVLRGDTNQAHRNDFETRLALRLIRKHPLATVVALLQGTFFMLTGPGQASLDQLLSGAGEEGTPGTILLPVQLLVLALILVGAALGVWAGWRSGPWKRSLAVPLAFIGYFLVLSAGPEAYSRFRVPILPFIAALSGVGWSAPSVRKALSLRSAKPQPASSGGTR